MRPFAIISSRPSDGATPLITISIGFLLDTLDLAFRCRRARRRSAAVRDHLVHPKPIHLACERIAELLERVLAQHFSCSALNTRASTSSRQIWALPVPTGMRGGRPVSEERRGGGDVSVGNVGRVVPRVTIRAAGRAFRCEIHTGESDPRAPAWCRMRPIKAPQSVMSDIEHHTAS